MFECITVAVVCARRSAPRVLLVEDTQKQSRLRHGARCRRWYVLHRKAHSLRAIFSMHREQKREERRRSRCRRRKNERILRKRVFRRARRRRRERRAEVASMGFPRVCENDFLYLSRRGEKTSKEDNLLWYRGRKKEGPRRKRRTSLLGPHVVAARCTSFLNGFNDARAYSRRRCRRRRRRRLFSISKTDSGLLFSSPTQPPPRRSPRRKLESG